jgi:hypothetical protein
MHESTEKKEHQKEKETPRKNRKIDKKEYPAQTLLSFIILPSLFHS